MTETPRDYQISEWRRDHDVSFLQGAAERFSQLESESLIKDVQVTDGDIPYFAAANFANMVLLYLGKLRLLELEKQNIVHSSTISGDHHPQHYFAQQIL